MPQDDSFSRRHVVTAGAAALALAAVRFPQALSQFPLWPYRAIYDARFEAGHRFARDAAIRGWITRAIQGDVTEVWYHELAVRWKRGPVPIAGLTTPQSLFVLERLAWDVGMRVGARDADRTAQLVRWVISVPTRRGIGL